MAELYSAHVSRPLCSEFDYVLSSNLDIDGRGWRFVRAGYDGTGLAKMSHIPASQGHPSRHRGGRFLITDAYATEAAFGDTTSTLWLVDLETGEKRTLVRVDNVTSLFAREPGKAQAMRVDLHPAWDARTNTRVAINGVDRGTRRVFVADVSALVGARLSVRSDQFIKVYLGECLGVTNLTTVFS